MLPQFSTDNSNMFGLQMSNLIFGCFTKMTWLRDDRKREVLILTGDSPFSFLKPAMALLSDHASD